MFDISGNMILPLEYDAIGYSSGATGNLSGKVVNNLLMVPTYKAIVFGKDFVVQDGSSTKKVRRYGMYDNKGNELIKVALDNAYFVVSAGVNTYYMQYNGTTLNVEEYLAAQEQRQKTQSPQANTRSNQ